MSEREKETSARRLHECDVDEELDGAGVDVAAFESARSDADVLAQGAWCGDGKDP